MPDETRVQNLLDELLDRQAIPEEVCGACPELLPVVRQRWRQICRARTELDALLPICPHGSLPTMPPEELPVPQVPGYEVESVLGRGGMGVVYRARHLRLGRLVALKMALAGCSAGPNERERFRREAQAVAALRHPNVVQVYDVGDADGRPYFTMELMESGSLARTLSGAPQPARQTAALLATLAGAVQAAHEAGVVHRDLKPGNVLLTADGTPKVADFGLARRLDADERLTLSGAVIGTPSYTAPEQARGDRSAVGPRTDVYALGAILYECLTGRPPFHAGTAAATLQQVVAEEPVLTVSLLGQMFVAAKDAASAEEVLSLASTARPREVVLLHRLGNLLAKQGLPRLEEAIGYYRAARSLRHRLGVSLSDALVRAGRPAQAEAVLQELLSRRPGHPDYLVHLGFALMAQRRFGDAEATYRQVIALDADYAEAHYNLGIALDRQGRPKQAEQACRDAVKLRPDLAEAHNNLGTVLSDQGRPKEAEQAFRDAIRLKPAYAEAHNNLGIALSGQGSPKEAEQAFRDAIELKPDLTDAHSNLGITLSRQGKHREAELAFRDAIRLKPDFATAHFNLGIALGGQGRPREAEQAFRDAIRLKPDFAEAHISLSLALWRMARFAEAAVQLLELDKLLPPKDARRESARQLRSRCQRLALLDDKLPALLEGTEKPASAAERLDLRELCYVKHLYASAARFSRDAFVAEPKLAEDVAAGTRYAAACVAALAGCGQGQDAADLNDAERARWRLQALEWLRLDLAWWGKVLEGGKGQARAQVRAWMQHWRSNVDFAGVRGNDALTRIPAEERKEWERFWAEVDALIRRASEPD